MITSFRVDGQSLNHSGIKFLKSFKFEANPIHAIDFASVELFSVRYLELHLFREYENQKKKKKKKLWSNFPEAGRDSVISHTPIP